MNRSALAVGLVLIMMALLAVGCGSATQEPDVDEPVGMPNPASVHCEDEGGKLDIRVDSESNQYGVCVFDDGSECEEWAFFRGECQLGEPERAPEPN